MNLSLTHLLLLAQTSDLSQPLQPLPPVELPPWVGFVGFAVVILMIAALWKVFTKAGQPGWAAIIPIYNVYILCKIGGKSGWWVLLLMVPLLNIIFAILLSIAIAEKFGKGAGFGLGLTFLGVIFYPILGFGDAQYHGGAAPALA